MARPSVDLSALVERLVGDSAMLAIFDLNGRILARFGADDLLGQKQDLNRHLDTGAQVDLAQCMLPDDQQQFVTQQARLVRGELETFTMRVSARHLDGRVLVLDVHMEIVRVGGEEPLVLVRAIDVTEIERREEAERQRMRLLSLQREWSQQLSLCPLGSLSANVGEALSAIAPIHASDAILTLAGPKGRGRRWTWSSGGAIGVTEVATSAPFDYSALLGNETTVFEPVVVNEKDAVRVTATEGWGNGMRTTLTIEWRSVEQGIDPQRDDIASTIRDISSMAHLFQGGFARLATDAIASAERMRAEMIFKQLSDIVLVWGPDGQLSYATPSFMVLLGRNETETCDLNLSNLVIDGDSALAEFRALDDGQTSGITRLAIETADQGIRTVEVVTTNLSQDEYVGGFVTTGRDMTEVIKVAERQARRDALAKVVASISSRFVNGPSGTTHTGIKKALGDVSEYCAVERALVWQRQRNGSLFVTHEYIAEGIDSLTEAIPAIPEDQVSQLLGIALEGQVELCMHDGHGHAFITAVEASSIVRLGAILVVGLRNADGVIGLLTFSAALDEHGEIPALDTLQSADTQAAIRTVGELITNVLSHSAAQDALTYNATHDSLTGLINRRLLLDRADRMLRSARRRGHGIGLLFLDIDDFKVINDTLGHDVGDELLRDAANRLRRIAVGSTVVARLGGDEFILLMEAALPREATSHLARQIAAELERPFQLGDRQVALKISIGAVTVEADSIEIPTPGDLVRRADMAMYAAKHRGGNTFELFSTEMEEQAQRRFNLHEELRIALIANQLELWYQPQVCLQSGLFIGCEALVRWRHPTKGFILPNEFIGAAEQAGLIKDLGIWVFTQAAETLAELRKASLVDDAFEVAVNVSPLQLIDPLLVDDFTEIATRFNVPMTQLKIELTESTLAERDRVIPNLIALRAAGFQTSIDDFGTGYSSLSYLRDLPLNELKIDRSFVMSIEEEKRDLDMVDALVEMAHSLGLSVVAEGVETEGQRQLLQAMGCNVGQGWLFSKPVPAAALSALLMDKQVSAGLPEAVH